MVKETCCNQRKCSWEVRIWLVTEGCTAPCGLQQARSLPHEALVVCRRHAFREAVALQTARAWTCHAAVGLSGTKQCCRAFSLDPGLPSMPSDQLLCCSRRSPGTCHCRLRGRHSAAAAWAGSQCRRHGRAGSAGRPPTPRTGLRWTAWLTGTPCAPDHASCKVRRGGRQGGCASCTCSGGSQPGYKLHPEWYPWTDG